MNFDFLFRNFEGVLSLTKRKAKILTILSLSGVLLTVAGTTALALDFERSKYIPGILLLACMMVLNVIFLIQGNYHSAVRVIFMLPLALYFLFMNSYYAIASGDDALRGIQISLYAGFLFLMVFSYSYHLFWMYYLVAVAVLAYFIHVGHYPGNHVWFGHPTLLYVGSPYLELTLVASVSLLIYLLYNKLNYETAGEHVQLKNWISEVLRQVDQGILVMQVQRDARGEKSGMLIKHSNAAFERMFKTHRESLEGVDCYEIFPILFQQSFNWQDYFFHNPKTRFQVFIKHIDKWFMVNNIFIARDLLLCSFTDISQVKQEGERYMIREQRLTRLMGSLPDIFFIIEKDGTYIDYVSNNPELTRLSQSDIIGKTIFEMGFSKPMAYQIYSSIQHVLEHDNIETIEYGMEMASGKVLIFEMRLARLNENQVLSIGRDITAKKEYQQQLIEAKQRTDEASRLKSAFLENISHEMRTPLNAIIGFSNLWADDHFSVSEKKNFQKIVMRNGEKLIEIITNVIDIAEIESGSIIVKKKSFAINSMLDRLYLKYRRILSESSKDIHFEMHVGHPSPDFDIFTDTYLLQKIMGHLIYNAIKFTHDGSITFGYSLSDNYLRFFVKDTGIGISISDSERIYEQFHQASNRTNRKYPGIGIGLTIVKNLVQMLDSSIEFESRPGVGSEFYFLLPRHPHLELPHN